MEKTLQEILDNEFNTFLGALPYQRTDERTVYRNGTYNRTVYTRVGPVELQVPETGAACSRQSCLAATSGVRRL